MALAMVTFHILQANWKQGGQDLRRKCGIRVASKAHREAPSKLLCPPLVISGLVGGFVRVSLGETHSDGSSLSTIEVFALSTQMDSVSSTLELVSSYQPGRAECASTDPMSSNTSDLTECSATDSISLIQSGLTDSAAKDPVSLIQLGLTDLAAMDRVSSVHSD